MSAKPSSDSSPRVITIDGPTASGKNTVMYLVAKQLGFHALDSGAFYRIVTMIWDYGIATDSVLGCDFSRITALNGIPLLDGIPPSEDQLHNPDIDSRISDIAKNPVIRERLIPIQRSCATDLGLVANGRDMGVKIFPDAPLKIFLTAPAEIRAARRHLDYVNKGSSISFEEVLRDLRVRDYKDSTRADSPLAAALDAFELDCAMKPAEEIAEDIVDLWNATQMIKQIDLA